MIEKLAQMHPDINFLAGETYSWNPENKTIIYDKYSGGPNHHQSVLHELAHALLEHKSFRNDVKLIKMERDAWALTKKLSNHFNILVDQEHIEDCLDTYRDWIYSRSKCPQCFHVGFQSAINSYSCVFCPISWKVPSSRLCMVKRVLNPSI